MPETNPNVMDAYLQRVMALKEERRAVPSEEELREIALEIGLSEEDLSAVDKAAEDHFVRGKGFLEHQRLDDAITELGEATALAPRRLDWLHTLATAHADRWIARRDFADRDRAEALARECLELDPQHEASFEVLNRLEQQPSLTHAAARSKTLIGAAMSALVLAIVLGGTLLWRSAPRPEAPLADSPPVAAEGSSSEPLSATEAVAVPSELDIPVTLDPGSTGLDLELEIRQARVKTYSNGKSFLTVNAMLQNRGDSELD
ncbi:MAG: hypothetical protein AAF657_38675, partial [Acidobacteriota bacterium]